MTDTLMMTETELMDWIESNSISWQVECDPHRTVYRDALDWLADIDEQDALDGEQQEAVRRGAHLYVASAYPTTPIGFLMAVSTSRLQVLRELVSALDG